MQPTNDLQFKYTLKIIAIATILDRMYLSVGVCCYNIAVAAAAAAAAAAGF